MDGLKRGHYSVVVCWDIDRLTRQGVSKTLQAVNRITKSGGTLVSLQEPWIETAGEMRARMPDGAERAITLGGVMHRVLPEYRDTLHEYIRTVS